ncbi:hypothetical protein TWF569_011935 [Orbilia oligospora]|uniref:Uncharacterized protein n=1 Tax=Orbilia oligospora TaxID=2813651 RepID=A0A7C8MWM4_ORBOL|nr:hypothetical protein TWF102_001169 [Orbilia oligospora]KAF3085607.1 hypothetical protein TWF706_011906 [Orbilia oligospora]KAF3092529.1 hypothetical protein TWF103_011248 [Orbilia oligospora]KAF3126925.1 hypothetical protein TWF569_011935 [Orbilia oligospora]KAF3144876.1 hypothetical protein TWF594_004467 [Orbilia oligospora]
MAGGTGNAGANYIKLIWSEGALGDMSRFSADFFLVEGIRGTGKRVYGWEHMSSINWLHIRLVEVHTVAIFLYNFWCIKSSLENNGYEDVSKHEGNFSGHDTSPR